MPKWIERTLVAMLFIVACCWFPASVVGFSVVPNPVPVIPSNGSGR